MMMGRFPSDGPEMCSKFEDEKTRRDFAPSPLRLLTLPINSLSLPIIRTFAHLAIFLKASSLLFSRPSDEQVLRSLTSPTSATLLFLLAFLFRSLTTGKFLRTHLSPSFFWVWEDSPVSLLFSENVWRPCPFNVRRSARLCRTTSRLQPCQVLRWHRPRENPSRAPSLPVEPTVLE